MSYGKFLKELLQDKSQSNAEYWERYSGRLNKNARGETRVRDEKFISLIEGILPGTKKILTHPLWKIMENSEASLNEIYDYMEELPLQLKQILFNYKNNAGLPERKRIKSKNVYYISKQNDLDALACMLMMIREAEITKQIDAYITCKWEAHQLFCRIASFNPLKEIASPIYDKIFQLFIEKNDPLPPELSSILVEHIPHHYQSPKKYPIPKFFDDNIVILKLAIKKGLVENTKKSILNFLFWIDFGFKRSEILEALISLPNSTVNDFSHISLPTPLSEFIKRINGDSRLYIKGEDFRI